MAKRALQSNDMPNHLNPPDSASSFQSAIGLFQQGQMAAVLGRVKLALSQTESDLPWLNLAAGACLGLGRLDEAEDYLRQALVWQPKGAELLANLGNLLRQQHRLQEAEACLRQALELQPAYAEAWNTLGIVAQELERPELAKNAYTRALVLKPNYAEALSNLGILLKLLGQAGEAEAALKRALVINSAQTAAATHLAELFAEADRFSEADAMYRHVLRLQPKDAGCRNNLGVLLKRQGRFAEAEAAFRSAFQLKPDHGHALGQAVHCARTLCDWRNAVKDEVDVQAALTAGSKGLSPLLALALPGFSLSALQQAGRLYADATLSANLKKPVLIDATRDCCDANKRLRIGYLSADLQEHATMHLLGGVLERHNHSDFEIFAYSYAPGEIRDDWRRRVENACDGFRDVSRMTDHAAAALIVEDRIDILVDLKGYTSHARLGIQALRPAPIVVSWLGYPGTLGHPRLADFIIGDPVVTPPMYASAYSETLALMPHCYQPNDVQRVIGPRPSRREMDLPEQGVVFCCFNQSYKITSVMFDLWCRILAAVPDSVLWLLRQHATTESNLRQAAGLHDIDPSRLIFTDALPHAAHLGRLQLADLALDCFPYGSHTTGSDALWAGVPLLARCGESFASRVSASLVTAVGLPELVADDDVAYFELACGLAHDSDRRASLRERLVVQRISAPLFDTQRFAGDLERLYDAIWERHCFGGEGPVFVASADGSSSS